MEQQTQTPVRVKVACERCGVQQLPARAVTLRCCENDGSTTVRYACSRCDLVHVQPVDDDEAAALASSDAVGFETWRLPVEVPAHPSAPEFSGDDVGEWIELLGDDDALIESLAVFAARDSDPE